MGRWCLARELPDIVIADASVMINLNATGCVARILDAVPFGVVVTDVVAAELRTDQRTGRDDAALLATLISAQLVRVVALEEEAEALFAELVIGPAVDTLDDGEASTIAYAAEHGMRPVIDERKARRICAERFPQLRPLSTVDLLMDQSVVTALGRAFLSDAIVRALQTARMRVLPEQVPQVIRLIGADRAARCPSLPASARRK